jgi:hypothetical protein
VFIIGTVLTALGAAYFAVVGAICVEFFCHSFRFKARTIYLILMGSFLLIGFLWSQDWAFVQFLPVLVLLIAPVRATVFLLNKTKGDYLNQFPLYKAAVLSAGAMSVGGLLVLTNWAFQNLPTRG